MLLWLSLSRLTFATCSARGRHQARRHPNSGKSLLPLLSLLNHHNNFNSSAMLTIMPLNPLLLYQERSLVMPSSIAKEIQWPHLPLSLRHSIARANGSIILVVLFRAC
ncbi:hypothetical protein BC830DRAFT_1120193 [Chytriomyces sp. MP71]|nr:hypothetical protein BC830DRAFT_1120193 [Chytriomyces sp. MP71]